jgi:hypothetical protein
LGDGEGYLPGNEREHEENEVKQQGDGSSCSNNEVNE